MNTLSRAITAQFFANPADYQSLKAHWRHLLTSDRKSSLTAAHHLLYLALIGKDWRPAFTPITNSRKLANGSFFGWGLFQALQAINSQVAEKDLLAPFEGLITLQMLELVRKTINGFSPYSYKPTAFT